MAQAHDTGYKLLFSNPEFVRDLLVGFVPQDWVGQVDFSSLEMLNGHYVSEDMQGRHEDMVWRLRLGDDGWVYLYLLLEFQSTPDRFMALRLLTYVGLFWQQLEKQGQLTHDGRLPPVLPLVLYNGLRQWPYSTRLDDLCHPAQSGLRAFQPHFEYLLIDENRYSDSELSGRQNLVAMLIRLEQAQTPQVMKTAIDELRGWLTLDDQTPLRRNIIRWIIGLVRRRTSSGRIPPLSDLLEVSTMLAERTETWSERWLQEGLEKGRAEGQAVLLQRQLDKRFGPLPEWAVQRIEQAGVERIGLWAEAIFEAQSLEELLAQGEV
ncbi:Rpn family recombination-promoting nuclease/putative transposase [Pseudomonas sp. ABC1]|uniref:Rpn family recombination-promoting nuclease/putative transposase n=1 Tax=Pseudomonas sp. ABC1 TaxID=2748080 RepID=UPI0015C3AAB7|nr:Rpn family recombination-promoting nuclease/putative transposase [Pseudomonas sp. ABC1]QLF93999.1 Rpn family recombination-promoting nuclease/putative transposase [Pseudomonas sp. ABC1]